MSSKQLYLLHILTLVTRLTLPQRWFRYLLRILLFFVTTLFPTASACLDKGPIGHRSISEIQFLCVLCFIFFDDYVSSPDKSVHKPSYLWFYLDKKKKAGNVYLWTFRHDKNIFGFPNLMFEFSLDMTIQKRALDV